MPIASVLGIVGVGQLAAVARELEAIARERLAARRRADAAGAAMSCFLPSLCISSDLFLDQHELALVDDPDTVGHLLGLLDVVRRQDDASRRSSRRRRTSCHMSRRRLDVDAGGRLVEEQDPRLVRQGLGDEQAALHAARQGA